MEVRQISNRKNKICLCVGIGMCIISVIEMLLIKFYFKSKWPGQNVDLFFLWLGVTDLMNCHGFAYMNCHQIDLFSVISQPHRAAA